LVTLTIPAALMRAFVASRYNFYVPVGDGALLYNANTGAVLHLLGSDAPEFAKLLSGRVVEVEHEVVPEVWAEVFSSRAVPMNYF